MRSHFVAALLLVLLSFAAADSLEKKAQAGDPKAQFQYAMQQRDDADTVLWLTKAAEQNYGEAEFKLAEFYALGRGTQPDSKASANWMIRAAAHGFPAAQMRVAGMYKRGIGVAADIPKAIELYKLMVERGDLGAESELADTYVQPGPAQNVPEALRLYQDLANKRVTAAEVTLGTMYLEGIGVAKDPAQARAWLTKAAGHGDVESAVKLAAMFRSGAIIGKDPEAALKWYKRAAEFADPRAVSALGEMFAKGEGIAADPVKGYAYYLWATKLGDPDGQKSADALRQQLSSSQLAAAEKLSAKLFTPKDKFDAATDCNVPGSCEPMRH